MASRLLRSHLRSSLRLAAVINPSSSSSPRRIFSSSPRRPVDIAARARQLQTRRLWTYGLTFGCIAGFVFIVLSNFEDQLLFYITPSDALARLSSSSSSSDPSRKTRFRLGGLVMEGSVTHPSPSSPEIEFVVTDLVTDILVRYEGSLPDLFREGHSVVVEGFLRPFSPDAGVPIGQPPAAAAKARSLDCYFRATEVLAKHDEKYMPKEVAAALEKNRRRLELEEERS